jgi:hypothetical protein
MIESSVTLLSSQLPSLYCRIMGIIRHETRICKDLHETRISYETKRVSCGDIKRDLCHNKSSSYTCFIVHLYKSQLREICPFLEIWNE